AVQAGLRGELGVQDADPDLLAVEPLPRVEELSGRPVLRGLWRARGNAACRVRVREKVHTADNPVLSQGRRPATEPGSAALAQLLEQPVQGGPVVAGRPVRTAGGFRGALLAGTLRPLRPQGLDRSVDLVGGDRHQGETHAAIPVTDAHPREHYWYDVFIICANHKIVTRGVV